jgi:hypothetical protein
MATIGRRAAVAQLRGGVVLRGTVGWLAWFGLHLVYLMGFRNRLTVVVNWTWRYLNWPSGPRIIIESRLDLVDRGHPHPSRLLARSGHRDDRYIQEARRDVGEAKEADEPRRVISREPARSTSFDARSRRPEAEAHG